MRKSKLESMATASLNMNRFFKVLIALLILYVIFLLAEFPSVSRPSSPAGAASGDPLRSQEAIEGKFSPKRPYHLLMKSSSVTATSSQSPKSAARPRRGPYISGLRFNEYGAEAASRNLSDLHKSAKEAWDLGRKLFHDLNNLNSSSLTAGNNEGSNTIEYEEPCPHSVTVTGAEFTAKGRVMMLPCGLSLGSHITLVARPYPAHMVYDPKIALTKDGDQGVKVSSQFMMELQGLKTVDDGEDPPRILHFNPRLKGDWSGRPVIEQNTCFRMQWNAAQRCEGWRSRADEETVDGQVKCEKWIRDGDDHLEESNTAWWLNRLIGRTKKVSFDWPYPFVEDKLFVLTLSAGMEGYHVNVDGRHVTSFPYRTGFIREDATALSLNGDIEVHSISADSLPTSHPSYAPHRSLEMLTEWQTPPLPAGPVELFIGILSAGNHFAERMAVRKSWMSTIRKSSNLVARFFVALHGRNEVNVELKKEAEFFGDIVIVPYMDSYDLVVLKTIAILEYGIHTVSAKYIMKCDDDTFVRIDSVMNEVKKIPSNASLYVGNINYHHQPMRDGKWAVTYEEWPEEDYPPYANGPGYVVSADIARFVVSEFEKHTLRLFKMEDVSVGMWVEQFNSSRTVEYVHSIRFCQFGCIEDYLVSHYQSPRQMLCLWDKLQQGRPQCCSE